MSLSYSEMPTNLACEQFSAFLRDIKSEPLRLLATMAGTMGAEDCDAREAYEDVTCLVLRAQREEAELVNAMKLVQGKLYRTVPFTPEILEAQDILRHALRNHYAAPASAKDGE